MFQRQKKTSWRGPNNPTTAVALSIYSENIPSHKTHLLCKPTQVALTPDDLVVSVHACGGLTDRVLDRAPKFDSLQGINKDITAS